MPACRHERTCCSSLFGQLGVVLAFLVVQPPLPVTLGLAGGLLGALAGTMQHFSISQDPSRFKAASTLMGVRRALAGPPGVANILRGLCLQGCSSADGIPADKRAWNWIEIRVLRHREPID
jgi:hypothetical protein